MKSKKNRSKENWIPCDKVSFYTGVGAAICAIVNFAFDIQSELTIDKVQAEVYILPILALDLLITGSKSLYIDEKGVAVYYFGLRLKYVERANVANVGTGFSIRKSAIVITIKGGKQYTLKKKIGYRDAISFEKEHFKSCIVLESEKVAKARPLIEKYYGSFDYEYIPSNND